MNKVVDWSSGVKVVRDPAPGDLPDDDPFFVAVRRAAMRLTRVQTMLMLVENAFITETEMVASQTSLPAALQPVLAQMPAAQRVEVEVRWLNFQEAFRNDPLIAIFASIPNPVLTDEQLDALFEVYAQR